MPEGVNFSSWYWHSTYDNEYNTEFVDAWTEEYGGTDTIAIPSFTGASTWAAIHMYKRAMENAGGTDPDGIISELEGMEFAEDPRGPITMDPDTHQARAPTIIGTTSPQDDVPYDGVGLEPSQSVSVDRGTVVDLLQQAQTDLPPGI